MIIFNRGLLRRIKSLESELGLIYRGKDFKNDYVEHELTESGEIKYLYGRIERLEKRLEEFTGKKE